MHNYQSGKNRVLQRYKRLIYHPLLPTFVQSLYCVFCQKSLRNLLMINWLTSSLKKRSLIYFKQVFANITVPRLYSLNMQTIFVKVKVGSWPYCHCSLISRRLLTIFLHRSYLRNRRLLVQDIFDLVLIISLWSISLCNIKNIHLCLS